MWTSNKFFGMNREELKESFTQLDEKNLTKIYHNLLKKALGVSKLPVDHSYTSAKAENGDFVAHDGGGRVVGRLKKGDWEHHLREEVLDESMSLDKVNKVHHGDDLVTKKFAKEYTAAHKGDYKSDGSDESDVANNEKFHDKYDTKHVRDGYGGSGESHYKNKVTGETLKVIRSPNGKTFYGTDHTVSKLTEAALHEVSKKTLGSYASKALQHGEIAARMSHSDTDDMGTIANKRLSGVKLAAKKLGAKVGDKATVTRTVTNIDKAKDAALARYSDKDDQGKSYYAAQRGINKLRDKKLKEEKVLSEDEVLNLSLSDLKMYLESFKK